VSTLVVLVAQYLLFGLAAVTGLVWLTLDGGGRLRLAVAGVLGLAVLGAGIWVAGHLHVDPRPFVQDPSLRPLFPHPADNGFPSDHAAAGGLLTALTVYYRRRIGVLVGIGMALVAAARVAAHVHHVQDVVAGALIGLAAGAIGLLLAGLLVGAWQERAGVRRAARRGPAERRS
jgi:undecaprenyl-diphosphatase